MLMGSRMILLLLIPLAWVAVTAVVVAACQVTSATERRSAQMRMLRDVTGRIPASS
jgi:hypothetical protein